MNITDLLSYINELTEFTTNEKLILEDDTDTVDNGASTESGTTPPTPVKDGDPTAQDTAGAEVDAGNGNIDAPNNAGNTEATSIDTNKLDVLMTALSSLKGLAEKHKDTLGSDGTISGLLNALNQNGGGEVGGGKPAAAAGTPTPAPAAAPTAGEATPAQ